MNLPSITLFICTILNFIENLFVRVLRCGPVPQHLAFIMDGNRRFARRLQKDSKLGHLKGFESLEKTLRWCMKLGVKAVTVYAFSIENFKRSKDEVDYLFQLAREKLKLLSEKSDLVKEYGIRIRILGDLDLLPADVLKSVSEAMETTKNNNGPILNICMPYTSRHEITQAAKTLVKHIENDIISASEVSTSYFDELLFTGCNPPLDILVRTSGEIRLSDFMLWQASENCYIHFVSKSWPEFSFWDMLPILLSYQFDIMWKNWQQLPSTSKSDLKTERNFSIKECMNEE
ncbi:putative undecaprenyl diphosphate synthase-domain-containing protein [Paraphysoderma sedebokerense]|nr:putative undecaprenyl diphosphate synthase-domain-containing protein [Paraphysoderma sedebokerense]